MTPIVSIIMGSTSDLKVMEAAAKHLDAMEIPYEILHKITYRITHEVDGINRVLYDLTPKPIGTIEWE